VPASGVERLCNGTVSVCPSVRPSVWVSVSSIEQQQRAAGSRSSGAGSRYCRRCVPAIRHRTGSHFVTQRPSDPGIQRPGDPVDPVTLFCNELQMSTYVTKKYSQAKEFLIIIGKSISSLHGLTFQVYVLHYGHFFENRENSGLTPGQNDDPVTRTWKMTQMTHWPGDPVTQFHVCLLSIDICRPRLSCGQRHVANRGTRLNTDRLVICCKWGHVGGGSATSRSSWEPEAVWRRPVVKPEMSDALWEATRTEALGSDELQRVPHRADYETYQVLCVNRRLQHPQK